MKLKRDLTVTYKVPRSIKEAFAKAAWEKRRSCNDMINEFMVKTIEGAS